MKLIKFVTFSKFIINYNCKKITFSEITGWWKDTGKPSDLIEANKLVLKNMVKKKNFDYYDKVEFNNKINGKIIYGKDSIIKKSIINGPVIIGNNVVIENSTVGPNVSLSNNCKVINSRIEDSIVMSDTSFLNIKKTIKNSLLGNNIQINQKNEFFNEINLIIGDQGKIEIG